MKYRGNHNSRIISIRAERWHRRLVLAVLFVCLAGLLPGMNGTRVFAYENNYDITHMDVDIVVNENNTYDVTETIDVWFDEGAGKHGIVRCIPTSNMIFREDGSTGHTHAQIRNVTVNYPCSEEKEGGYLDLRIGSADKYVEGNVQYVITYTYDLGRDILHGADEFYFNIVGTEWDTTVESTSFAVHFPKEFQYNEETLGFTHGYAYSSDYEGVTYKVEENTVYGVYETPLNAYEGLTMRLTLPEGYFIRTGGLGEATANGFLGFPILSFIAFLLLYLTKMRNKKPVEPVEFYPPDGLSPLWIGYYYDGRVDKKDITTMLIWLASKGYLEIHECGPEDYDIILLKDYYPEDDKEAYVFYDGLLRLAKEDKKTGQVVVSKKNLEKKFYRTYEKIKSSMNTKTTRKKYLAEQGHTKGVAMLFGCVSILVSLYSIFYFAEYNTFAAILFSIVPAFFLLVMAPILLTANKIGAEKIVMITLVIVIVVAVTVMTAVFFALGGSVLVDWSLWQTKVAACGIVLGILTVILSLMMRKRTKTANEMLGRIRGFRKFLVTAEKPRLEMLVAESPSYFYDILPYTYVLGVTSAWIRKFDKIAMKPPGWYTSSWNDGNPDWVGDSLNRTMDRIGSDMTSAPASSGSSGGWSSSSSSGSWSSSGSSGGGSSGGGSGGGGGHSW